MSKRKQTTINRFHRLREQHSIEMAEDYTELVLELEEESGSARITDLARRRGISHVTALRTARRLATAGYLKVSARSPLTLTPLGRRLAHKARERHQTVVSFLKKLGVPKQYAELDAEGIEHHVSTATMHAIRRWMKNHR